MDSPLVGIVMGSRSDWETMRHAAAILTDFQIPHECRIVSAHRTPDEMHEYGRTAAGRGLRVIVAGAGGAAHLPGMLAAQTRLPVLGVPVKSQALQGLDSLLSIVQMPGGVPVGTLAIGEAARIIARGHADCMVAGSTGTWVHPMKTMHAHLQFDLADGKVEPEKACRPFDLHRRGAVVGEGAAALVLENLETARARGATIHAEVLGSASSQVADKNFVADRRAALRNVMIAALRDAGMRPGELGHLNSHGLGTQSSDLDEAKAIHDVFGDDAGRLPVVAAKSYFGNLGAGSGVVEAVASLLALANNALFPILNLETPDPECNIRGVREFGELPGDSFLNVNVNPQGQAASVLIARFKD